MNSLRQSQGQRHKPSTWSRSKRELASPQGLTLTIALMFCFFLTVVAMILESYLHVPKDIVLAAIIVSYILVIGTALSRISRINKLAAEKRKKAYREKFGRDSS